MHSLEYWPSHVIEFQIGKHGLFLFRLPFDAKPFVDNLQVGNDGSVCV